MNPTSFKNKFESFTYKSIMELEDIINKSELNIPISHETKILKTPVEFQDIYFPNRLSINPMEGFDSGIDGSPTELTYRRYKKYAKGGAGLIWFEACAISENCRSNEHQLMITEQNVKNFKELVIKVREICNKTLKDLGFSNECVLILQLNHSGRYSRSGGIKYPIRAFDNSELDAAISVSKKDGLIISDDKLKELEDIWVRKAILANEAGFDGVDIKACHGYLISELLSARSREDSEYGGKNLDDRTKFFLNIIKKLKSELKSSSNFFITTRLGIYDGIPYPNGFGVKERENQNFPVSVDLTEPIKLVKQLYQQGVRLINISAGNPHYTPHLTRPYNTPVEGEQLPAENPLYGVSRIINLTSLIKQQIPKDMVLVGSCYSFLRQYAGYVVAGLIQGKIVDICGFGRMGFANPNFPRQIFQQGKIDKKKTCVTCSKCSELMKVGKATGCVLRDPQYI
ncbi:MAG: flavin oxidoreductase/NADH oxidase [Candidatus Helarchaeota archaeon]|nr:flavin oxidoreductase/NADH oxidase [Candidatus Helarchaeota archaeon]